MFRTLNIVYTMILDYADKTITLHPNTDDLLTQTE